MSNWVYVAFNLILMDCELLCKWTVEVSKNNNSFVTIYKQIGEKSGIGQYKCIQKFTRALYCVKEMKKTFCSKVEQNASNFIYLADWKRIMREFLDRHGHR